MFHENVTHAKKPWFTVLPICNIPHDHSQFAPIVKIYLDDNVSGVGLCFSLLTLRLLVRHFGLSITHDYVAVGGGEYRLQDRGRKGERPYTYL